MGTKDLKISMSVHLYIPFHILFLENFTTFVVDEKFYSRLAFMILIKFYTHIFIDVKAIKKIVKHNFFVIFFQNVRRLVVRVCV